AKCTAPVAVVGLNELDAQDLEECRAALWHVLAECARDAREHPVHADHDEALWRRYLSMFWLRPETALVGYSEALALRRLSHRCPEPWMDIGCGDALHLALYRGYTFPDEADAFGSLDLNARDIYDHWDPAAFNAFPSARGRPARWGVDIKPTAIARANAVGCCDELVQADVTALDMPDNSVGTIFSNMIRDRRDNLPEALASCARVLRPGGALLLSAMTPDYASSLYFAPASARASARGDTVTAQRYARLDRGRAQFCAQQLPIDAWRDRLADAGLVLTDHVPMMDSRLVRLWDIGLRPFSIPLVTTRNGWASAGVLPHVKAAVVQALASTLDPVVRLAFAGPTYGMHMLLAIKQ
ncbi:MAG: hypothetical protein RLZZ383_843, partial [Pseudomonadota bacterium]